MSKDLRDRFTMQPLALLNGTLLPQPQATLPLNDAGFVLGATVTDLCRTFKQVPYRWTEHLARFRRSSAAAHIDVPFSDDQITEWAHTLCARNATRETELALVLFATPGPVGYYLGQPGGAGDAAATFGMHTFPLPFKRYRGLIERGAALVVPSVRQVPAECVDPRIKQRSRMHWWLAEQDAKQIAPGSQALLLDTSGHLTETAAANFLIVRDGTVISPPRDRILGGISLGVVEELCGRRGIAMAFRPIALPEALAADEAMLTSTPYCVAGVRSINGTPLPWPGPVMERLIAAWSAAVGVDIHRQITA
jgi:branched-subunit amino acid aminotransferase/4-amino-4-deoxychorismate lyase